MSLATDSHSPSIPDSPVLSIGDEVVAASDAPQFRHWRCSIAKYHEMIRWGIFHADDRLELLDGVIVRKHPPRGGPQVMLWRCSVEQYHEMTRRGILGPEDRVELLEGLIVKKMTKYPLHTTVAYRLVSALECAIPQGFYVRAQDPVTLSTSEPEPDAAVTRGACDDYSERHPNAADIPLIAEVADSSLADDRSYKKRLYADNRITIYWIVNLIDRQIEIFTGPAKASGEPDYSHREVFSVTESVPLVIDGRTIALIPVREIIPEETAKAD
jgi:hypothetical protein